MARAAGIAFVITTAFAPGVRASPFVALDQTTGSSHADARLGAMFLSGYDGDGSPADLVGTRLDLHAEYSLTTRAGLVATLPFQFVYRLPGEIDARVHGGPGALHAGGYYRVPIADRTVAVLRVGLIAPTEYLTKPNDLDDELVGLATLFPLLEERLATGPLAWVHLGPTLAIERDRVRAQVDALVDIPLVGDLVTSSGLPWRVHLGAGAAYTRGMFAISGELLMSGYLLGDGPFSAGSDLRSEASFGHYVVEVVASVHWKRPTYEVAVWLANPLDGYILVRYHPVGFGITAPF
jgi:hypothetical protein